MWPAQPPGQILRVSTNDEILDDEIDDQKSRIVFNSWQGIPIGPIESVDANIMKRCNELLDKLLGYLTRNNPDQMQWIRRWLAFIVKNPGDKQQIAWVTIGGKGVGKSWIGNEFMGRLLGNLYNNADSQILGDKFAVESFINRLLVFIDEVSIKDQTAINNVKKLTRNVKMAGQEKFQSSKTHDVFARLMVASNYPNIGAEIATDRAVFVTKAYDKVSLGMSERQFADWAETLKPFFTEFTEFIEPIPVRAHFIKMFCDTPVDRAELESTKLSSGFDVDITMANLSWTKQIAKALIEEGGNIIPDTDITMPFNTNQMGEKLKQIIPILGLRAINTSTFVQELKREGLVDWGSFGYRFKYKWGTLIEKAEEWLGVKLNPQFVVGSEDFGDNQCTGYPAPKWKGTRIGVVELSMTKPPSL